ncbi:putative reverse transcriptase domain-containing protein [Tanacetum coccineum]
MPPRRLKKRDVNRLVKNWIAKAITEYKRSRANPKNAGGSSGAGNVGGAKAPETLGCSYNTFLNCKPQLFKGTEGVVGLSRWFEKMEQVFEISKCAEEDKVRFVACTFEGRALTWWNGNVHTFGLTNANQIPWSNVKTMMTTEYCSATEIQKIEQEVWTLTMKGDDIEGYNNRFHELALMCPDLVTPEKKKNKRYIRGLPERVKADVTSSKPASLHDAINMTRELIEQAIQAKAMRISESNKRKWEYHQRNNNNRNINTHHQQQNRRQEVVKDYVTAAKGRGYTRNLPLCNKCKAHHHGPCPPRCGRCHMVGHHEKDCRTRIPIAGGNSMQNVTCFGCGKKGHYKNKCPNKTNQQNEGAHGRTYVMRTEDPQQNSNVVTGVFLLNDHYASIIFDSGAEKSFVSTAFTPFIDIAPAALDTSYDVELADGKVVITNIVLRGFTLALFNHVFNIDLLLTQLGSFDVIVGMDWLSNHRAVIVCYEKIVQILLPNGEILGV